MQKEGSVTPYTTHEAARVWGVTPQTAWNWVRDGKVEAESVEGKYRISEEEVQRIQAQREKQIPSCDLLSMAYRAGCGGKLAEMAEIQGMTKIAVVEALIEEKYSITVAKGDVPKFVPIIKEKREVKRNKWALIAAAVVLGLMLVSATIFAQSPETTMDFVFENGSLTWAVDSYRFVGHGDAITIEVGLGPYTATFPTKLTAPPTWTLRD